MRHLTLLTAAFALTACTEQAPTDFAYRSTMARQTAGVVLHEDGEGGHAGMFGTNCPFETRTGSVTGDYDLPGQGEQIQDAESTVLGEITISAVLPDVVHVLDKTDGEYTHVPVEVPGVVEARLLFDGVTTLDTSCTLETRSLEGESLAMMRLDRCDGGFEVDPATNTSFVATLDGSTIVRDGARIELAMPADLVAWDPATSAFYAAARGTTHLTAVEPNGQVRWEAELPGPIRSLDDAGTLDGVAIVMEQENGSGWIGVLDGGSGEFTHLGATPSTADALSVSGNGRVIALVRAAETYFFDIL